MSQQVEDEAKSFVDDLVAALEEQAHRTAAVDRDTGDATSESAPDGKYVIRITRDGKEAHRVAGSQQAETMAKLVDYLIKEEGLVDAVEIPYVPGTWRGSRALLNDEPKHTDGSEMRQYEPVSGGYYLFTKLGAEAKKRYLPELPEKSDSIEMFTFPSCSLK